MKHLALLLLLAPAALSAPAPAALSDPAPAALAASALSDFRAGSWQVAPLGGGATRSLCLGSADALLLGARPPGQCSITPISSDADSTVVTWRCAGGASGRTALRRDSAGVYTLHIQGIDAGLPFAEHAEWRRLGAC